MVTSSSTPPTVKVSKREKHYPSAAFHAISALFSPSLHDCPQISMSVWSLMEAVTKSVQTLRVAFLAVVMMASS